MGHFEWPSGVEEGSHYVAVTGYDPARGYRVLNNANPEWWPDIDLRFGLLASAVGYLQNIMQDNDFDEGTVITFVDRGASLREAPTALEEVDSAFQFLMAPNKDLVVVKKRNTGSKMTEVHILSAACNYQEFLVQTPTKWSETDDTVEFALGPRNDLWAFTKSGTGSHTTEIHILSAASNYQAFSLQTSTALHETDQMFTFALNPLWKDVVAVKKPSAASKANEVHILRSLTGYKTFSADVTTLLQDSGSDYQFFLPADFNPLHMFHNVNTKIWGVRMSKTAYKRTELLSISF